MENPHPGQDGCCNRQPVLKRKDNQKKSNGSKIEISKKLVLKHLGCGVILLQNCLSKSSQQAVVDLCGKLAEHPLNKSLTMERTLQAKGAYPIAFYNWPKRPSSSNVPAPTALIQCFQAMSEKALDYLQKECPDTSPIDPPSSFDPTAMYAILYPEDGKFGAHLDGAKGWAMALSVGRPAVFGFSPELQGPFTECTLRSGDAIFFKGGKLYHRASVTREDPPSFWNRGDSPVYRHGIYRHGMARLNIQFRDAYRDWLDYDPQFPVEGQTMTPASSSSPSSASASSSSSP